MNRYTIHLKTAKRGGFFMIRKTYEMQSTVLTTSPTEFDEKVNAIVQEHSNEDVNVMRTIDGQWLCACITWKEESLKPETASDRLSLKGIDLRCGECKFFELPEDKRIKFVYCEQGGKVRRCSYESNACEWMCEQLERGEIEL